MDYNEEIFERELEEFRLEFIKRLERLGEISSAISYEQLKEIHPFLFEKPISPKAKDSLIKEFINNFPAHLPGREYRKYESKGQLQKSLDNIITELNIPNRMLKKGKTTGETYAKLYIEMRRRGYEREELIT